MRRSVTFFLHVRVQIIPPRGGRERIHVTKIEGLPRPNWADAKDVLCEIAHTCGIAIDRNTIGRIRHIGVGLSNVVFGGRLGYMRPRRISSLSFRHRARCRIAMIGYEKTRPYFAISMRSD
jgi:hypothetical protein